MKKMSLKVKNIDEFLALYGALLRKAVQIVKASLMRGQRIALGDVAFELHRAFSLPDDILEWRLKNIVSTAEKFGAFKSEGLELRRGVGFVLLPARVRAFRLLEVA